MKNHLDTLGGKIRLKGGGGLAIATLQLSTQLLG